MIQVKYYLVIFKETLHICSEWNEANLPSLQILYKLCNLYPAEG